MLISAPFSSGLAHGLWATLDDLGTRVQRTGLGRTRTSTRQYGLDPVADILLGTIPAISELSPTKL